MNIAFYLAAPVIALLAWFRPWSRMTPLSRTDADFEGTFQVETPADPSGHDYVPGPVESVDGPASMGRVAS